MSIPIASVTQTLTTFEQTLIIFQKQIDTLILQLKSLEYICEPPIVLNPPSQYEIDLWNYKPVKKPIKIMELISTDIQDDSE
jgi:hypothetical protein